MKSLDAFLQAIYIGLVPLIHLSHLLSEPCSLLVREDFDNNAFLLVTHKSDHSSGHESHAGSAPTGTHGTSDERINQRTQLRPTSRRTSANRSWNHLKSVITDGHDNTLLFIKEQLDTITDLQILPNVRMNGLQLFSLEAGSVEVI